MITREEALALLKEHIKSDAMIKHSLASEAIMRAAAKELGEEEEKWGIAGLLHDIDVELTGGDHMRHAFESRPILQGKVDDDVIDAIEMHNAEVKNLTREKKLDIALTACETISGFITAIALIYPDKKVASVKVKSITKRMKENRFAAGVSREKILECEKIGIPFERFAEMSLKAMQDAAPSLGL
ncbi:Hydrolase family protein [Elusimicrobium minutum Pei191]|uniref:Hydrolase family protein n=1 Tax=Elusimicrobium minutum (strain Pei191) TaxID=445932 RepID=B2KAP9_ELUMP|nr:HD domain-containing protein [Elusimicrobium minutum]ACC97595.1 Hydrolase family protein [Elusimicrobium minutum Pei191]